MCSAPFIARMMFICGCFFLLSLVACTAKLETAVTPTSPPAKTTTAPTATAQPAATAVPAATAKQGTSTPMAFPPTAITPPTAVPTIAPSLTPNMPAGPLGISPENAEQLTQLAQWGNGRINNITWSPDGKIFAVGGSQGINFYDAATLQAVRTLSIATDYMVNFSFNPQGNALVVYSCDLGCGAVVWDVASDQYLHYLDTWTAPVFTSDGQSIVYVSVAAGPLFWEDFRTGERQGTVKLELGESSSQILGPGGETLAEVNVDDTKKSVRLWDTASGQLLHTIEAPAATSYGIAFSPQGDLLAIPGEDGIVRVWNVLSGQLLHEVEGGTVVFSPDGRILILATSGGRLLDMTTGQLLHTLTLPQGRVCGRNWPAPIFSPDGGELAMVSMSGVLFFDVASGELQRSLDGYCFASELAFSPDSNALITASGYDIRTLNVHSGQLLDTRQSDEPVRSIAISPDGSLMAWGGGEQQYWVQLWDVASGEALYTIEEETEPIDEVVFSPDGQLLATQSGLGQERLVQLHEAGSGKLLFSHKASRFAFSLDGRLFSTSWDLWSENATIELWDATTFQLVRRFEQLALLAFSPDGNILAERRGENRDGSLAITAGWWDIDSGELLRTFVEKELTSYRVFAFSPDNRLLLGHEAGAIGPYHTSLWDVNTGEKMAWSSDFSLASTFSPDGRYLATVSSDGIVRLWGLPSGAP